MIQLIRGFKDILPGEVELWQHIEKTARDLFEAFGFKEIRIPIMERTELFARSIGEDTDIVEKEMYTFPDRKGDLLTLRPEATASVVRAYIQHKLYSQDPVQKFCVVGPMFRRERPQKGRYRQFYQIDAEVFGSASPYVDALLVQLLDTLMKRLGVTDVTAHINSLGCPACRPAYREALGTYLSERREALCADCERRRERNPLRVLDCKVPACREAVAEAPALSDYFCEDCRTHFQTVQTCLTDQNVAFTIDPKLVRGLDYYTRTIFEIQTSALGAQSAVAGGGRYDGLVKMLGGPDTPATGFAIGFDRLAEIVAANRGDYTLAPQLFIAALGQACRARTYGWSCELGRAGIRVEMDFSDRSLKSMMKRANRMNAAHVLIVGPQELDNQTAVLRNMQTKVQDEIPFDGLVDSLKDKLR